MSKKLIVALAALLSGLLLAQAPPNADQDVAAAGARIAAGDFAGAASGLEKVVAADPGNKTAWRYLGFAYLKQKKYADARAAYARLLALVPDAPPALYNTGVAYALEGNKDEAFVWLGRAKDTGKIDMTQIQVDEDLASLSSDPRFHALLPEPEQFAHPFVEAVRVLREWDGEAQGDQFGWTARSIGDVDGVGIADYVTCAPVSAAGGKDAGR